MRRVVVAVLIVVAIAAALLTYRIRHKEITCSDCNVVLITIDTLRADHLPPYGYKNIKTPAIDLLASQSFVFDDAIAQIPMTLASHATILTGLLPFRHGIRDNAGFILDPKITTLAEILKSKGYKTAAFVSAFVLDSQFGLDQGFDLYSDDFTLAEARVVNNDVYRRADATEIEIDAWLKQNHSQKFFLWAHYYDPHDPYDPPEPFKTQYSSSPYDGEIAYTDHVIAKLFHQLSEYHLLKNTVIVMTGDHGEGLGEHKEQTHSLFIYNATQHVPLLIHLPSAQTRHIGAVVSHIDVAPTLLELLEIHPDSTMDGKSLIPLLSGKEMAQRAAYSESMFPQFHYGWSPLKAVTTSQYKFIEAPKPELYDRKADPGELKNLYSQNPQVVADMRKQLAEYLKLDTAKTEPKKVDPETEEKLRALGYVGTIAPAGSQSSKVDPKDRIDVLEALSKAGKAMEAKNYPYVLQAMDWVEKQDPNIVDAHFLASSAYLHLGNQQKGLEEMLRTISLKPDHTQTLYNLALFYQLTNKISDAEHWYLQLLKYEPESLYGNLNLAALYLNSKQPDKAKPYLTKVFTAYEKTIQMTASPESKSLLLEKVAEIYFRAGDLKKSEESVNRAIQYTPQRPILYFHLGNIYRNGNDINRSVQSFRKAMQMDPKFYPAYYALAETFYVMNTNLDEALRLTEAANQAVPNQQGQQLAAAIKNKLQHKDTKAQ